MGSVMLVAYFSARVSLFAGSGYPVSPSFVLASFSENMRHAVPFVPTESLRLGEKSGEFGTC